MSSLVFLPAALCWWAKIIIIIIIIIIIRPELGIFAKFQWTFRF